MSQAIHNLQTFSACQDTVPCHAVAYMSWETERTLEPTLILQEMKTTGGKMWRDIKSNGFEA